MKQRMILVSPHTHQAKPEMTFFIMTCFFISVKYTKF